MEEKKRGREDVKDKEGGRRRGKEERQCDKEGERRHENDKEGMTWRRRMKCDERLDIKEGEKRGRK